MSDPLEGHTTPGQVVPAYPVAVGVPEWLLKSLFGLAQGIMMAALLATITWAWNTEGRVARIEAERSQIESRLRAAETQLEMVRQNDKQIDMLKLELMYIKDGLDDIKELLKEQR